jgi:aminoglycoside phosphotransferase (APT) family kinase protein
MLCSYPPRRVIAFPVSSARAGHCLATSRPAPLPWRCHSPWTLDRWSRRFGGHPQTFVHGNWKLDNLGTDADGRTVLLDWELPGRGAALSDLAWYLAINCRRLPQTKEEAIDTYRGALERHGVDTAPWWDTQLALCLLGALVQFGWEKAFGGYDDELAWWEARAIEGARLLS